MKPPHRKQPEADAGIDGLLGWKVPQPFEHGWRVFYSQQR
jgi:hypothetical protein